MKLAPPPPQVLVIFGASGDLTRRKILPALYNLSRRGLLPERCAVVGYARSRRSDEEFRERSRRTIEEQAGPLDEAGWKEFAGCLSYLSGPYDESGCFAELAEHMDRLDAEIGAEGRRLYYLATPPSAFAEIVRRLGECGSHPAARIVVEKPFGRDLATARELSRVLYEVFGESQVFRIDHYLGKETVQNILVFRFANAMFERVWNRDAIDHVQITVAEADGVGARGGYYEQAGALRDMVPNHILQVLAFLAMEPPRALEAEAIREEKIKVLRVLRPFDPKAVVRGQYGAGRVQGRDVPGYRQEEEVSPDSEVETFVAARARIENWRWAGVPFFLRTGKRLPRRASEVAVVFREAPSYLFEDAGLPKMPPDHLVMRIQPEEGISFSFQAKEPGPGIRPGTVEMDFSYGEAFGSAPAEAYERLLHDAMLGDHTLFPRQDGVERGWEVVEPALGQPGPIAFYPAGSWGPEEADGLIAPRRWHLR